MANPKDTILIDSNADDALVAQRRHDVNPSVSALRSKFERTTHPYGNPAGRPQHVNLAGNAPGRAQGIAHAVSPTLTPKPAPTVTPTATIQPAAFIAPTRVPTPVNTAIQDDDVDAKRIQSPAPRLVPSAPAPQLNPSSPSIAASLRPTLEPQQGLVASALPTPKPTPQRKAEETETNGAQSVFMLRASLLIMSFGYGFSQGQKPGVTQMVTGFAMMLAVTQTTISMAADGSFAIRRQHASLYADSRGHVAAHQSDTLLIGDRHGVTFAAHRSADIAGHRVPGLYASLAKSLQSPFFFAPPAPGGSRKADEQKDHAIAPTPLRTK